MNGKVLMLTQDYAGYAHPLSVTCRDAIATARKNANRLDESDRKVYRRSPRELVLYISGDLSLVKWHRYNTPYHSVVFGDATDQQHVINVLQKKLANIRGLGWHFQGARKNLEISFYRQLGQMKNLVSIDMGDLTLQEQGKVITYLPNLRQVGTFQSFKLPRLATMPRLKSLTLRIGQTRPPIKWTLPTVKSLNLETRQDCFPRWIATCFPQLKMLHLRSLYLNENKADFPNLKVLVITCPLLVDFQSTEAVVTIVLMKRLGPFSRFLRRMKEEFPSLKTVMFPVDSLDHAQELKLARPSVCVENRNINSEGGMFAVV
jgi:hypothetical protein